MSTKDFVYQTLAHYCILNLSTVYFRTQGAIRLTGTGKTAIFSAKPTCATLELDYTPGFQYIRSCINSSLSRKRSHNTRPAPERCSAPPRPPTQAEQHIAPTISSTHNSPE